MRFLIPILALACWAKSPSEKITILQRLPNAVIDLGLQEFEALTQQPLDYTLYVLFTTSNPEHNCEPCEAFEKEYKLVAELAKRSRKTENVYFAKVDFVSAPQVFQKLQLNSAPLLYRYYAKSKKHDAYPIEQYGTSAESFARFVAAKDQFKIEIKRPMSLTPILTIAAGLLVFVGLYLLRQQIRNLFVFENIFVFGAMVFSTIMCSGYMWNQIRHPPYVGRSSPGQSGLISPGYQSQYGIETNVVAGLYLLISASFIGLSKVKSVSGLGRFVVFTILMGTFMVSYSMMMKIFKVKNGGYPFKLLF